MSVKGRIAQEKITQSATFFLCALASLGLVPCAFAQLAEEQSSQCIETVEQDAVKPIEEMTVYRDKPLLQLHRGVYSAEEKFFDVFKRPELL